MTSSTSFPGTVLFACTHNMIRSPIAEGIMKQLHPKTVFVDSCGINAGASDGFVITVMQEIGIDMTKHEPKSFGDLDDEYFDLIICFSEDSYRKAQEFSRAKSTEVEYWPVFDTGLVSDNREERLAAYRLVRDRIRELIKERFGK
jgi:protein-tyrosine-phosphatase